MQKKTPSGTRFIDQLIRVNDQVCFAAFQQFEFSERLKSLNLDTPEKFTTEIFPENPFSKTSYRRLAELSGFAEQSEQTALQMGIIAAVEYVLAYIEEVQELREQVVPGSVVPVDEEPEEMKLCERIGAWGGGNPVRGYFRTLGYFRLLRNHYAHVNEQPSTAFATYIRTHATPLNRFWDNGMTNLHGIDFKTLPAARLTPHLAFGVMNLLRVSVQHIDHMMAQTLSTKDAISWCLERIRSPSNLTTERRASKLVGLLETHWGIIETPDGVARLMQDGE